MTIRSRHLTMTLAGVLMLVIATASLLLDANAIPMAFVTLGVIFIGVGSRQRRQPPER